MLTATTLELLKASYSFKIKVTLFQEVLNKQPEGELASIIVLTNYFNMQALKLAKRSKKFTVVETKVLITAESVSDIIHKILSNTAEHNIIISKDQLYQAQIILNPNVFGISHVATNNLASTLTMSLKDALSNLGLSPDLIEDIPSGKQCGVCGRLKGSIDTSNVCVGCRAILRTYTKYRRYSFSVPINTFNINKLEELNDVPIEFTFEDYKVTKDRQVLNYEHYYEYEGRYDLPLPFKEFARQITEL